MMPTRPRSHRHSYRSPRGDLRLSDADRDEAIARLSEHYAAGRLDKDEFDERSDAVWTAKTGSDLAPIFADLGPTPSQQARHGRGRRGWRRVPFVPVLLVLIALTVLTQIPFVLLALVGMFLLLGRCRGSHWGHPQMSGNRF
jgi:hypothetical protein